MSYISIDVDIDDIVLSMSKYDRRKFFEAMQAEGYISEHCVVTDNGEVEAPPLVEKKAAASSQDDFNLALKKLWDNGWKLTKEEEDCIIGISKRFIL